MEIRFLSSRCLWLAATALLLAPACESESASPGSAVNPQPAPQIKTLSNRADMISGGDALVEIVLAEGVKSDGLHVTLGTKDITSSFAKNAGGRIIGLVTGLADGPNIVAADLGTGHGSYVMITNHKIGGPVFSGPQVTPFTCATPTAVAGTTDTPASNASGLSAMASDAQCNIATEARLFYRTSGACNPLVNPDPVPFPATAIAGACFKPYSAAMAPNDVAMTTTDTGVTVPFIVRVERGTLNRGIYDIAVLFDPSKDDLAKGWKPTAPQAGWNGKVLYAFGFSSGQPRQQFHSEIAWADATITTNAVALGKGFLVAVNSLTDSLYNSNRVTMSETVMMMKEKIIDTYGEVHYVMGNGCSGGSINQLTTASIYPGLLDGIQPTCTYPDSETTGIEVSDCALLVNYYTSSAWQGLTSSLTPEQIVAKKAAINGHLDQKGCHAWVNSFTNLGRPGNYIPTVVLDDAGHVGPLPNAPSRNNCALPAAMVYDPVNNPKGIRCTVQDHAIAVFGKAKNSEVAGSTNDNVGVQYGLKALLSGAITAEEFVTLNENIGGIDVDDNFSSAKTGATVPFSRTVADTGALDAAYRAGLVGDAKHWARTPIIDLRGWDDQAIHHVWRSFALRARLDEANGTHANHIMWRYQPVLTAPSSPDPATAALTMQSFVMMDQWLTALKADATAMPLETKVLSSKPVAAFDFCNKPLSATSSTKVTDMALCDADPLLKPHASPRQIAGGPVAENILKCQLRPINPADYNPAVMTADQLGRLGKVFPDGVCDFTKPGVSQQDAVSPLDFSAGPGGVPFAPEPLNKAF